MTMGSASAWTTKNLLMMLRWLARAARQLKERRGPPSLSVVDKEESKEKIYHYGRKYEL